MKIICVATPSANHTNTTTEGHKADIAAEGTHDMQCLPNGQQGGEGLHLYMKPETAISRSDWPFFVPDWSEHIEASVQLAVRICRLGKSIPERYAHRYYDEVTVGISFTAKDILSELASQGLPWEIATGFDGAAYCGQKWLRLSEMQRANGQSVKIQDLDFDIQFNEGKTLHCNTRDMLYTVDQVIAYASRYYLLKTGDLIFTGTPVVACRVNEGDVIAAKLEGEQVLTCRCK